MVILQATEWPPTVILAVLSLAWERKRIDLVGQLRPCCTSAAALNFELICRTVDPVLIGEFSRRKYLGAMVPVAPHRYLPFRKIAVRPNDRGSLAFAEPAVGQKLDQVTAAPAEASAPGGDVSDEFHELFAVGQFQLL